MPIGEAGRRGARKLKELHDHDWYVEIGGKGGRIIADRKRGTDFFKRIGKKGGDATVARHGRGHLSEVGREGGEAVKARVAETDPDYYSRIGRIGARERWRPRAGSKK